MPGHLKAGLMNRPLPREKAFNKIRINKVVSATPSTLGSFSGLERAARCVKKFPAQRDMVVVREINEKEVEDASSAAEMVSPQI